MIRSISDFLTGAVYFGKGIIEFYEKPRYWKYVIAPFAICAALYAAGVCIFIKYAWPPIAAKLPLQQTSSGWYEYLSGGFMVLSVLTIACIIIIAILLSFTTTFTILAIPFLDRLSLCVEKYLYNSALPVKHLNGYYWWCLKYELFCSLRIIFWSIVLLPVIFLVPYAGFLLYILVPGYYFGVSLIIYSAEHRGMKNHELDVIMKKNRFHIAGFGAAAFAALFIPFAALLILLPATVGGTMLFNKFLQPGQPLK